MRKLWWQQLSLILGGIMAGVFLGELGLHLGGIKGKKKPSEPISFDIYRLDDPDRGWSLNPGASFPWLGEGEHSFIHANFTRSRTYKGETTKNLSDRGVGRFLCRSFTSADGKDFLVENEKATQ
jgi:hypothetical protein